MGSAGTYNRVLFPIPPSAPYNIAIIYFTYPCTQSMQYIFGIIWKKIILKNLFDELRIREIKDFILAFIYSFSEPFLLWYRYVSDYIIFLLLGKLLLTFS